MKLRLPPGETVQWEANNPTFHRTTDYRIVLTDQALYLRSAFWFSFVRWRRFPFEQIQSITFRDSWLCPSLRVATATGGKVLRTPWDDEDEMNYDRNNLRQTVARVLPFLKGAP